jgi:hypothetical protein
MNILFLQNIKVQEMVSKERHEQYPQASTVHIAIHITIGKDITIIPGNIPMQDQ